MLASTIFLATVGSAMFTQTKIPTVEIRQQEGAYQLYRDGRPYEVRGVGLGDGPIEMLVEFGGNSVRTWGADQLDSLLPKAKEHDLTILAGIWIEHTEAMDYSDKALVEKQKQTALSVIRKYKDRPEILMWGIGNEAHGFGDAYTPEVYKAINEIVREGKKIDPSRPFITVNADLTQVQDLLKLCTDVDAFGFNTYGGALSIVNRYKEAGGKKPVLLTEFGPLGRWELPAKSWGAVPEPSSTEKAQIYRQAFEHVQANKDFVIGVYPFFWGNKQEVTHTWFGMITDEGAPLAQAQVVYEFYKGEKPKNLCPVVNSLILPGETFRPGQEVTAELRVEDPEGKPYTVEWTLREEQQNYDVGGREESKPKDVSEAIVRKANQSCTFVVPQKETGYRLYALIKDDQGNAATANVVFLAQK